MRQFLLLILCCVSSLPVLAVGPFRKLPALNKDLFTTPISDAITRQTFIQLHTSQQLATWTQAERTLLLTHKFIAENNHWPRTVIVRQGQIIPKEKYTTAEQSEVSLGRLLRRTLENSSDTSIPIRETLENLKTQYSPVRMHIRTLEQLNHWLTVHQTWPREHINQKEPLTPQEQFETALARQANKLCSGKSYACPKEILESLRYIRSSYDLSYIPLGLENRPDQAFQLLDHIYNWINKYHSWPSPQGNSNLERQLFWQVNNLLSATQATTDPIVIELASLKEYYKNPPVGSYREINTNLIVRRPATEYELLGVRPEQLTSDPVDETSYPISQEYIQNTAKSLVLWLIKYNHWPQMPKKINYDSDAQKFIKSTKSLEQCTITEMQATLLLRAISRARKKDPKIFDVIYTTWKEEGPAVLQYNFLNSTESEP